MFVKGPGVPPRLVRTAAPWKPTRVSPRRSYWGAVLAVCAALAGAACGDRVDTRISQLPPVAVEAITVHRDTVREILELVGELEAEESVVIKSETQGIIDQITFDEGAAVRRGALLFRLRDDEQRARLTEAAAQLVLAADEYRRAKALAAKGTISPAELDRAAAAWQAATARRDLARIALRRTEIRAPFDGVLGARPVSPGDRIDTDTGLVRLDAVERLRLAVTVPERSVPAVRTGMPVAIALTPWPGRTFPGEIYFVAPALDPQSRRLLLKAWVPNPGHELRPGLFATVDLEVARRPDALVVPESAVTYDARGAFLWRIDGDGTAAHVAVKTGIRRQGLVEIVAGVSEGDRVVSAGTHKLAAGARVAVVPPEADAGPAAATPAAAP